MKDAKRFWNSQAKNIDNQPHDDLRGLVKRCQKYLKPEDEVLDYGCGSGQSSLMLSEDVKTVLGLDYASEMIACCKPKVKQGEGLKFICGDIHTKALKKNHFDAIVAFNILHLVDDLEGTLDAMARLVKAEGTILAYTPLVRENRNLVCLIIRLLSKLGLVVPVRALSHRKLKEKFEARGFILVKDHLSKDKVANSFMVLSKQNQTTT